MKEKHFMVKLSITVKSDDDGDFYINPTEGNVERLIRESLRNQSDEPDKAKRAKARHG